MAYFQPYKSRIRVVLYGGCSPITKKGIYKQVGSINRETIHPSKCLVAACEADVALAKEVDQYIDRLKTNSVKNSLRNAFEYMQRKGISIDQLFSYSNTLAR